MLIAAKRKKQEVAGKIGHDEYAYKIKGEASNLPENRRVREQGEFTPNLANYNNNENASRNAISRPPYGIDGDGGNNSSSNNSNNNNNNAQNKNLNLVPAQSPFVPGYMSPYSHSPSPALNGPMYNNPNNYFSNNNNNYSYRPASTPIPAQSVVPPLPSLPPCTDLPGPLPSVYRPKPPLMLQRGVEGSDNMSNDYLTYNNNNNYVFSPSFTPGVGANLLSAPSQTPSLLPQIGKEYLHDNMNNNNNNNGPLRIRSAPTPSSANDPYYQQYNTNVNSNHNNNNNNNNGNMFRVGDEKVDEVQRKLEERRKAQELQQDNARQMEEQRLRKAAERAKQIMEEREEDERVQRERELVVAKEQTEIAREAYEKQLKENGPIAAEPYRAKYEECQRVQREREMQQRDYKRVNSATHKLMIAPSIVALPVTTPTPLPPSTTSSQSVGTGQKETTPPIESKPIAPTPTPTLTTQPTAEPSISSSNQSSTLTHENSQWPQTSALAGSFTAPTLYDTHNTIGSNSKVTLAPLWTPPPPPPSSSAAPTTSSTISSGLATHDIALSLDPSYSNLSTNNTSYINNITTTNSNNNSKLYSSLNNNPVSSTLLSTPHLPYSSSLPLSRVLPETSKLQPSQTHLSSSFSYENDTLRDEIHELSDNQQRMERLLLGNERLMNNSSSLLPANMLNSLQVNSNNNNIMNSMVGMNNTTTTTNNFASNNFANNNLATNNFANNGFVPTSIINNNSRRNSNSNSNTNNKNNSARRGNGSNQSSRSNSRSNNNNNSNDNNINNNNNVIRCSTPNVVTTGNTFLTRSLATPQPQLQGSSLLHSSINSLNPTHLTPYDANSTAPFIENSYVNHDNSNTFAGTRNENNLIDSNNNNGCSNGSEPRRRSSLVKFTEELDEPLPPHKDLMVSTRLVGGSESYSSNNNIINNEPIDALTARGDYLMNLAQLESSTSGSGNCHVPEVRMLEKELSVEPSLFVGASSTTNQKTPKANATSSSGSAAATVPTTIKAPVKTTTILTLSPRALANASEAAKKRIIKEESSDEEEYESEEEVEEEQ